MKRSILYELKKWKEDSRHKPLLIRGARQVGKTYIIRKLGQEFQNYVEVNFELYPEAKKIFDHDLDPERIIRDLSAFTRKKITPGVSLLFFDEIQEAAGAISALRYFYEMLPQLHVIAAGSLLDFELENIGLPVGRVASIYMYPLSFMEFLAAKNEGLLIETIFEHDASRELNEALHNKLLLLLGEYMTVGGMPEAVAGFVENPDLNRCFKIHRTIIDAFRQDFHKYAKKYQVKYVELLFNSVPGFLGKKFKFSNIPGEYRKRELMPALELLVKAGVAARIIHSSGQGVPLAAAAKEDVFKVLFLDIALSQSVLGGDTASWLLDPGINFINKGGLTEAFVGQELLAYSTPDQKSDLFYWQREERASNAELDYLIRKNDIIVPIEVKSGAAGHLKSLRLFLDEREKSPYGVRFSVSNFFRDNDIHTYPLYAVAKLVSPESSLIRSLL
jgi:predicted AAA+ superfamily ATPase